MQALERAISDLGDPLSLVELRDLDAQKVAVVRWQHGDKQYETSDADALRVVLNVRGTYASCNVEADHVMRTCFVPGHVVACPPGRSCQTTLEGSADVVKIYIDAANLGHPAWRPDLPSMAVADGTVRAAAVTTFVAAQAGDGPCSRHAATALQRTACKHLLSQAQTTARSYKGGLRPAARRRAERLVERRLDEQGRLPGLGELAAEARLSVNQFIRAFRQMTGTTPHQHVMAFRQQRAMALLSEPGFSVSDVADLLGFSSPAHFVASFRQRLGVTPGAYQDAVLSAGQRVARL